jgi:hypothetical protein
VNEDEAVRSVKHELKLKERKRKERKDTASINLGKEEQQHVWKNRGNSKENKHKCSVSRWRPQKVDKRMVLEHTHGLFIT